MKKFKDMLLTEADNSIIVDAVIKDIEKIQELGVLKGITMGPSVDGDHKVDYDTPTIWFDKGDIELGGYYLEGNKKKLEITSYHGAKKFKVTDAWLPAIVELIKEVEKNR
jgi:hypothetical protein